MKKIAAFFDVDGTIFRNSLLIEHFKILIKNDLIDINAWTHTVKKNFDKWTNREGNYDTYLENLAEQYLEGIKGLNFDDIDFFAKLVINQKGDKLYRFTKERIKYHKEQGHILVIISGSPNFLVEKMAKKLGVEHYYATEYITKNNVLCGEIIPMWDSESKKKVIEEITKKFNIDLKNSYAYGDTTGDFTMMSLVGNPYAINPAKRLLNMVCSDNELKEKIKIIIERKDVIYDVDIKHLKYNKEEENDTSK